MHRLAATFVLVSTGLCGQTLTVDLDPARSTLKWVLVGNVHTVHGTFRLKQGHATFDTMAGIMSGQLVADAASGESGNSTRDKRMNNDVLESQRFPEIRLTPTKAVGQVNSSGHSTVVLSGTFLIHGTTHDVTLPLDVTVSGADVRGTGKFSIPYVDWGMKDPSNFLFKVEKSVEVEIVAVGTLTSK